MLIGVGAGDEVGCMPAGKVSMMIIRPPKRGEGRGIGADDRGLLLPRGVRRLGQRVGAREGGRCWRPGCRWQITHSVGCGGSPWGGRASGNGGRNYGGGGESAST